MPYFHLWSMSLRMFMVYAFELIGKKYLKNFFPKSVSKKSQKCYHMRHWQSSVLTIHVEYSALYLLKKL